MDEPQFTGANATENSAKAIAISVDQIGIWTSGLCVAHCLLTPVLISFSAVFAHFIPSEERTHRLLAVIIAAIGALALIKGYRSHRRPHVLLLMTVGLACIFAGAFWGNHLSSHAVEVLITFIGSGFMIAAHRLNHTFCRDCSCSHSDEACCESLSGANEPSRRPVETKTPLRCPLKAADALMRNNHGMPMSKPALIPMDC